MPYIQSPQDGASLFYVDYRPSAELAFRKNDASHTSHQNTTLVFIHGWPFSSRMYEHLILPLTQTYGIRCVAIDRRGFGKSEWTGRRDHTITYQTFAADTLAILESIPNLDAFTFVAASMGCGEALLVQELMTSTQSKLRAKGFIWLGPSIPYPTQTPENPLAPPQEIWDMIVDGFRQDRTAFVKASMPGVFGVSHGNEISETVLDFFMNLVYDADAIAIERCCRMIGAYDFTSKLNSFAQNKPAGFKVTLIHGTKDQSMPLEAGSLLMKSIINDAELKVYENAAHGLYYTHREQVVKDILEHLSSSGDF